MSEDSLVELYNYDEFIPEKFGPLLRFDRSPVLGQQTADFALWHLDGSESSLSEILSQHLYTVVEFGSFT